MMLKLRMVMASMSVALLAGCGPVAADTGGKTGDVAPAQVVSASPSTSPAAETPAPVASPEPSPASTGGGATEAAPATTRTTAPAVHCGADYYVNSSGNCVHRPEATPNAPAGATAQCNDGTYSFSQHRQGTCSHHGGVRRWL